MKNLRPLGLILLILGMFFFFINYTMISSGGFYMRRMFGASVFMIVLGLGLTICGGEDLTPEEQALLDQDDEADEKNGDRMTVVWYKAPFVHKVVWVVSLVLGFLLGTTIEDWLPLLIE